MSGSNEIEIDQEYFAKNPTSLDVPGAATEHERKSYADSSWQLSDSHYSKTAVRKRSIGKVGKPRK